ncbi:hypothetical protein SNE40_021592 [Patella caerulea]|uniref:Uncharacterized protein n=1 Tax=Patella caerulea TaxID=87958 RepID=A0AAN8FZU7_PATCE
MFTLKVAVFVAIVAVCSAHLCMLSPAQRGSLMGFNKAGANDCFLVKSPCGGRPKSDNVITLRSMQNLTVVIQKNLDHWAKATPGQFKFNIAQPDGSGIQTLGMIPDMGEPSLTLYALNVTIPSSSAGNYILQTEYVTKNAQAPPVFYQCADIMIM